MRKWGRARIRKKLQTAKQKPLTILIMPPHITREDVITLDDMLPADRRSIGELIDERTQQCATRMK